LHGDAPCAIEHRVAALGFVFARLTFFAFLVLGVVLARELPATAIGEDPERLGFCIDFAGVDNKVGGTACGDHAYVFELQHLGNVGACRGPDFV
jgi:hypothetical protein